MDDIPEIKDTLRGRMKAARRLLSTGDVERLADAVADRVLALPAVREAGAVLCYVGVRGELPTRSLIERLLQRGGLVAVPRVAGPALQARQVTSLDALVPGAFGIPTSDGPDITDDIDVCLTPGLGFTVDGHRLGYGGGFYDRFLAAHPHVHPIGLAFDVQILERLPIDLHDRPMQTLVTPSRALICRPGSG